MTVTAPLVTLAEAKDQLRITVATFDTQITRASLEASDAIVDYLKAQADPNWTDVTAPPIVKAAVLLMLTHLWDHRGDDMAADELLWAAIGRMLARRRDPALA